jgi:hypothetical protein
LRFVQLLFTEYSISVKDKYLLNFKTDEWFYIKDELGDYNAKRDLNGYASQFEFMPNQSAELEKAAETKHIKLR